MSAALRSSSRRAGWLWLVLCISSSVHRSFCQQDEGKVAWLVPEGGSQADVPPNATTFAKVEDFLTCENLAVFDTLLLTADYRITAEEWGQQRYVLQRNLTIASAAGFVFKLEFDFVSRGLRVPTGVTVTLQNLAIGEVRDTPGWSLPFFTGDGGTMILLGVVRVRLACLPLASNHPESLMAIPRPPELPGAQQVTLLDYFWRGTVYPGSVHSSNLALFLGPGDVDDMQAFRGHNMLQLNVTRVCLSYVSSDCTDPPDICLSRAVQQMLHGTTRDGQGDLNYAALLAAIVVPVVAAATILAAVAALIVVLKRKQRQKQLLHQQLDKQQQLLLAEAHARQLLPRPASQQQQQQLLVGGCGAARGDALAVSGGWGSGPAANRLANICSGATGTIEDVATGAAAAGGADGSSGWRLMACHNAPEFRDATPKDRIALGLLLGVGSFGRVYKGSWRGMEVAVKVLHHDSNTAAAVANEVDLVMSFKHPNITTAFHFVTWNYENAAAANLAPAESSLLEDSTAANAAAAAAIVDSRSCSPDLGKQQIVAVLQVGSLHDDALQDAAAAGAAGRSDVSGTTSTGALALLKTSRRPEAAAAAAAALNTDEQAWSAASEPADSQHVVIPIGALMGFAGYSSISSASDAIAAGPPAAAAAAAMLPTTMEPAAAAVGVLPAAKEPAAAAAAVGESWSSTVDCYHSSISNAGSSLVQLELATVSAAAAAAAAVVPAAVVSATTDSQPVQMWPSSMHGQRRPFVLLTPLQLEPSPELHLQQQQQQQQFSPLSSTTDNISASQNNSATRSSTARRSPPCEAQTWLVMEYCDGGTLLDVLQEGRLISSGTGKINMARVLTLLCDVAAGMSYLHSRNVLHGDLKPGNVLLKQQQGAPFGHVCKVTDFGMSRCLGVGQSHRSTRTLGTVNHTSPELLRLGRLSPAGDIYAFGVLMWELYTGRIAWAGLHYGEVFERVALMQDRPPLPPDMPADYAALLAAAWSADPFTRPSFDCIRQQLAAMLAGLVQAEDEAAERFVCDLV